jgi:hypothetical protein
VAARVKGAGRAAAQAGNRHKARHYFSKLLELAVRRFPA